MTPDAPEDGAPLGGADEARAIRRLLDVVSAELGVVLHLRRGAAVGPGERRVASVVGSSGRHHGWLALGVDRQPSSAERVAAEGVARLVAARLDGPYGHDLPWDERAAGIREVLRHGLIDIVFQPIVDLRSGVVVGVEALSRFPDAPDQKRSGSRDTLDWFRDAAVVGLGPELELLAVSRALEQVDAVRSGAYLAVNVSPDTVMSGWLSDLLATAPLDRLVLEITEHARVSDYDTLNAALGHLRARGLRVAVDDAGAGFASLRHILEMSPEIIKLDRSLTRGIDGDLVLRALAYSLTAFSSAVGATVVAEGIEYASDLDALQFLGVAHGQGFHLADPGPLPAPERVDVSV